jgi:hypothetical protein
MSSLRALCEIFFTPSQRFLFLFCVHLRKKLRIYLRKSARKTLRNICANLQNLRETFSRKGRKEEQRKDYRFLVSLALTLRALSEIFFNSIPKVLFLRH